MNTFHKTKNILRKFIKTLNLCTCCNKGNVFITTLLQLFRMLVHILFNSIICCTPNRHLACDEPMYTLVGCEGGTTGLGTGGGCVTTGGATGAATGTGGSTVGVDSVVVWAVVIVLIAAIVFLVLPPPLPSATGVFECRPTMLRGVGVPAPTGRPTLLLFFIGNANSTSCKSNYPFYDQ